MSEGILRDPRFAPWGLGAGAAARVLTIRFELSFAGHGCPLARPARFSWPHAGGRVKICSLRFKLTNR